MSSTGTNQRQIPMDVGRYRLRLPIESRCVYIVVLIIIHRRTELGRFQAPTEFAWRLMRAVCHIGFALSATPCLHIYWHLSVCQSYSRPTCSIWITLSCTTRLHSFNSPVISVKFVFQRPRTKVVTSLYPHSGRLCNWPKGCEGRALYVKFIELPPASMYILVKHGLILLYTPYMTVVRP